jgi:alkanesulfonate monooxygenase SsuD/methylene tetrahydromethanopterin reductase-like flavin-dependent oxidoreductase (luciferase family)
MKIAASISIFRLQTSSARQPTDSEPRRTLRSLKRELRNRDTSLRQARPDVCSPTGTASVQIAGRNGWSVISSALLSVEGLANHWAMYRKGCQEAGRVADGANWRVRRSILVAGTDEEARMRAFGTDSGHRHFFGHMHKVYTQLGRLGILKTRPDMRDDEVTVDTFIEQRLIYGSPKTVFAKLIALHRQVGPFGCLLLSTVDWAGPNAAWERESWSRLIEEVMPGLREHAAAA